MNPYQSHLNGFGSAPVPNKSVNSSKSLVPSATVSSPVPTTVHVKPNVSAAELPNIQHYFNYRNQQIGKCSTNARKLSEAIQL